MTVRTMELVQACELGREAVNSVSASVLANVLKQLVGRYQQSRRAKLQLSNVLIRCGDSLEIRHRKPRKFGEDEGFESDEDTGSTTSSCCLVEDHVFKDTKNSDASDRASPSATSISLSTDSANSSGSSDTDDVESPSPLERPSFESFPIADVIFCHTEPRHPNTIAWVIKRKTSYFDTTSRLGKTGVENIHSNENCLDVIVVKCKSVEDFKKLCDSYRELSRRMKLDHYKSIGRRKPIVLSTLTDTKDVKVSLSDMKVNRSSLLKASELSILNPKIISSFKSDLKNSVSLNSLLKPERPAVELSQLSKEEAMKKSSSLSNISPGKYNLLHRTDLNGMMHTEVSKPSNKSKIQKEIEGVILTDVESNARRDLVRQRQNPSILPGTISWRQDDTTRQRHTSIQLEVRSWRPETLTWKADEDLQQSPSTMPESKSWMPDEYPRQWQNSSTKMWRPDDSIDSSTPPQRPERRKQLRKKIFAPMPPTQPIYSPPQNYVPIVDTKSKSKFYLPIEDEEEDKKIGNNQSSRSHQWNEREKSLGSWKPKESERPSRKSEDRVSVAERRRARSVGRLGRKIPMAYRYIDIPDQVTNTPRLDDGTVSGRRRRNSFDDVHHKSIIKSNHKGQNKHGEPKKVTFSAFATVQVVD